MVHGNRKFSVEVELEICAAYKAGDSSPRLAERFSCSKRTILSVLKRHSIEMRTDRRRFTDEQEQEIARLYQEERKSINELEEQFGCLPAHIWAILKRRGVKTRKSGESRKGKSRKLKDNQIKEICDQYQAGVSAKELGQLFSIDETHVATILVWNGIARRDKSAASGGIAPEAYPEIVDRYQRGQPVYQIAKTLGFGYTAVRTALIRSDIQLRDAREALGGVPRELHTELCSRYEAGETGPELMKAYKVQTPAAIYSVLRDNGIERRESNVVGDSVQLVIDGTNNFENERETSFYIYTLHNLSGYLKFGIAFDPKTRASVSQGYYADNILEKVFSSRHAAFFFEQAILEATRDFESYPQQLIDIEWDGLTEVRQMNQEDAIELFKFLESELEQVSLWDFAARYVPMTDTRRKICLDRAKSVESGED